MQFSSSLNNGLVENLDRFCGTSITNYSLKNKAADINDALDWYFSLAFRAGLNWEFDDINQTSPPIDTQNLVSGTNRYKFSAFTEKIVNLINLEILTSSGTGQILLPETLDSYGNIVGNTSGQIGDTIGSLYDTYINAPSGTPTHYLKYGDFIYLRPKPNFSVTSGLRAYFNRPASKFNFLAISSINTGTDVITSVFAHGMSVGDTVIFETDGTIPTGLTADTQYYVASVPSSTTFTVSATSGGSAVDITNAQTSSNHSFLQTSKEPGINSMHHLMLCRRAAKTFMDFNNTDGTYNARLSTLVPQLQADERTIEEFFGTRSKDIRQRLSPRFEDNR